MKQGNRLLFFALASPALATSALAATHIIQVGQPLNQFSPQNLTIDLGDTVIFTWVSGSHTVVADNSEWTTFPMNAAGTHEVVLSSGGTVDYHCGIHGGTHTGMWGSIMVIDPSGLNPSVETPAFILTQDVNAQTISITACSESINAVTVVSANGSSMIESAIEPSGATVIDLTALAPGLYIVAVTSAEGIRASRLITKL